MQISKSGSGVQRVVESEEFVKFGERSGMYFVVSFEHLKLMSHARCTIRRPVWRYADCSRLLNSTIYKLHVNILFHINKKKTNVGNKFQKM